MSQLSDLYADRNRLLSELATCTDPSREEVLWTELLQVRDEIEHLQERTKYQLHGRSY